MDELIENRDRWRVYPLADVGRRYIEETLKSGGALAAAVAGAKQLHDAFTLLPADVPSDATLAFQVAINRSGGEHAWLSWVDETIRDIDGCLLLAENYEVDAGSRLLETMCPHVVTPKGILLRASCDRTAVIKLFRDMSRYRSIVFIGSYEMVGGNGTRVSAEQVWHWAHASRYVLVGAYDEESFVAAALR